MGQGKIEIMSIAYWDRLQSSNSNNNNNILHDYQGVIWQSCNVMCIRKYVCMRIESPVKKERREESGKVKVRENREK